MINHTLAEGIVSKGNLSTGNWKKLHSSGLLRVNYQEVVLSTRIMLVLPVACIYEIPRASTARTV